MMKKLLLCLILLISITLSAQNKTWMCINEKGETVFTIDAISVYEFHSGLARIYKNTLVNNQWITGYGFIDRTGKIVIECNLAKAQDFDVSHTWAMYKNQDYYTLIDKKGKAVPAKNYKKVGYVYDNQPNRFAVYEDDKMGFIDSTGKEIIPCKYIGAEAFQEGLASVCNYNSVKGEYGFINENGEEVVPLKFIQAGQSHFYQGLARASVQGKTVLINKKGEIAFRTAKGNIQGNRNGLICIFTKPNRKGWGWINFKDQFVIQPVYDYADDFNEDGYAIVEKNGLKGIIDTTGKVVLDLKYETVYDDISKDGRIMGVYPTDQPTSLLNSKIDYFNADFKLVNTENVKYIYPAKGGKLMPYLDTNGKQGYLDRNFEIAVEAIYSKTGNFSEGLAWVIK